MKENPGHKKVNERNKKLHSGIQQISAGREKQ